MSSFFSTLSCCWFWFLLGGLIGWLLNRFMCKCCCKPSANHMTSNTSASHAPSAPAKIADVPAAKAAPAAAPVAKVAAAALTAVAIDLAAAKKAGFALKNANDLTIVEGIGPKINELFNNVGVKTFAQLAAQTVPQMRKVLDDGGSRFRIANPSTWAQQADLAAQNKWDELKKLQDKLSGGIKK